MATKQQPMLFAPGNNRVSRREIVGVRSGAQTVGELEVVAVCDHGEAICHGRRGSRVELQLVGAGVHTQNLSALARGTLQSGGVRNLSWDRLRRREIDRAGQQASRAI